MDVPCPSCGNLTPAEELVTEVDGPPLCKSCAALELVRQGPRRASASRSRTSSGDGSFVLGFVLGFLCCPSLLGLFIPGVGGSTKKGIVIGFLVSSVVGFAIERYLVSQGYESMYSY